MPRFSLARDTSHRRPPSDSMSKRVTQQNNFRYLTGALVVLLFGIALASELGFVLGQLLIQAAIVTVLLVGVWGMGDQRHWRLTRVGLVVAILLVTVAGHFFNGTQMEQLWLVILLCYLVLTAWLATKQVLLTGPIDSNKIVGALCIFLLMGLAWTTLYLIVAQNNPRAFHGIEPGPWYEVMPEFVYFSFVSLTTLGYGDVGPLSPIARFLAYAEAITGQFYLAVLVASLVGIRISSHNS